jgi:hypothetical protein
VLKSKKNPRASNSKTRRDWLHRDAIFMAGRHVFELLKSWRDGWKRVTIVKKDLEGL